MSRYNGAMEMNRHQRRLIQVADKYVRRKTYTCLFPGCTATAVSCHAISRASIGDALAEHGHIYTLEPSSNSAMRMEAVDSPAEVVEVGINEACTFKGFCARHDTMLFAGAETTDARKRHMVYSCHLRALALEYCRKRQVGDHFRKLFELSNEPWLDELSAIFARTASVLKKVYLDRTFSDGDGTEYQVYLFSQNLQVSCCGCFPAVPDKFGSAIGYNLISYAEGSLLVLTTFRSQKGILDTFLAGYDLAKDNERLINEIAFLKGEEPLIAPKLWHSLSEGEHGGEISAPTALVAPERTESAGYKAGTTSATDKYYPRDVGPITAQARGACG